MFRAGLQVWWSLRAWVPGINQWAQPFLVSLVQRLSGLPPQHRRLQGDSSPPSQHHHIKYVEYFTRPAARGKPVAWLCTLAATHRAFLSCPPCDCELTAFVPIHASWSKSSQPSLNFKYGQRQGFCRQQAPNRFHAAQHRSSNPGADTKTAPKAGRAPARGSKQAQIAVNSHSNRGGKYEASEASPNPVRTPISQLIRA